MNPTTALPNTIMGRKASFYFQASKIFDKSLNNDIQPGDEGFTPTKANETEAKSNKKPGSDIPRRNAIYLDHFDIKQRAIQIFHTDYFRRSEDIAAKTGLSFLKVLHPNDRFRRTFDLFTVIWVLLLVATIPFEIGFDWHIKSGWQKVFMNLLDIWFGVDIILNFRTGYIHHGTIVMKLDKVVS